jgi:hypothetical protein
LNVCHQPRRFSNYALGTYGVQVPPAEDTCLHVCILAPLSVARLCRAISCNCNLFLYAGGAITNFFLTAAADSDLFGHQLIWALNSEARPPEEALNPEVKR